MVMGKKDLVLGGNQFHFQPQFARLDASYGHVLFNKGNATWEWEKPSRSGLQIRGEIREILYIPVSGKQQLLFLQNNDFPMMYQVNK